MEVVSRSSVESWLRYAPVREKVSIGDTSRDRMSLITHIPAAMPPAANGLSTSTTDQGRLSSWPIPAAIAFWAAGLAIAAQITAQQFPIALTVGLVALAVAALGVTAWAMQRVAAEPIATPFAALGGAAATLLALTQLEPIGISTHIASFLVVAPWRYALPPLVVHFALEIAWPELRPRWIGWLRGWYAVQAGLLVAAAAGVAMDERPLVEAIDATVRPFVLQPAGVAVALAIVIATLTSPARVRNQRRALAWTGAAALSMIPLFGADVLGGATGQLETGVTLARMAIVLVPVCAALAILALPLRDPAERDVMAHRFAMALIDNVDIEPVLHQLAATLCHLCGARGAAIRIIEPRVAAVVGDVAAPATDTPFMADIDHRGHDSELVLPIGRRGAPLGDVHINVGHGGLVGPAELEWITAFLQPIATALRARQRETTVNGRFAALRDLLRTSIGEVIRAAEGLPPGPSDAGLAVPPPVDAREVLAQLSDGVTGVAQHGEGLFVTATEARERARAASDTVARSLDRLAALAAQLNQLTQHGDEIASNNDTVSGVAFRTNLVANNAALEATRAGAAGRTFGVLAEEVRRLADTTATTSVAITSRTNALSHAAAAVASALDLTRHGLAHAIRDAEAAEQAAQRLSEAALQLQDVTHSLHPAVTEANAVARRRSARDNHLTGTLDRLLSERSALHHALVAHRDALNRLATTLHDLDAGVAPPA